MLMLQRNKVKPLIEAHKGKFFSCSFVKKDGSNRNICGHVGAVPGHNGYNNASHCENLVTISLQDKGQTVFRNINVSTMYEMKIAGQQYKIVD